MDSNPDLAPTRAMLENMRTETVDGDEGFEVARQRAQEVAGKRMGDPMLLAFWDGSRRYASPADTCGLHGEPGWVLYAKSRGADLAVHSPELEFVFLFADAEL